MGKRRKKKKKNSTKMLILCTRIFLIYYRKNILKYNFIYINCQLVHKDIF